MRNKSRTKKMLLIGALCLCFSISAWAQKVSLNFKETKMETVLSSIKKQTGMELVFSDQVLNVNRKVTIRVKNAELEEALNKLLAGTGVSYEIRNKRIYFVVSAQQSSSKEKKVKGIVTDKSGEPIIGANVLQANSDANGTITDVNGNFELEVPGNATLKVTYIGYTTQDVAVMNKSSLAIVLQEDSELLDEVVVIGYGTAKRKDLTGAVSILAGDKVASRQTTQLSAALQGAVPGVMVTRSNGEIGASSTIRVRGITSMSANDPLVIIDGVPGGSVDDVNANDVENLTVLKDAASASIYGARAAAGVILITTKRAKKNDLKLSYTFEYGLSFLKNHQKSVGPERFMQMANEMAYNDNPSGGDVQIYQKDYIDGYRTLNEGDPDRYPITDWYEETLSSSAPRQSHVVSIAGGTENVKTTASLAYDKEEALYANRTYERIMVRVNNDFRIGKLIGAELDFNFKHRKNESPYQDNVIAHTHMLPSIYAAKWSDGRLADGRDGINPLAYISDSGFSNNFSDQLGGRASIFLTPLDGLRISGIVSPNYNFTKKKTFQKAMPYTRLDEPDVVSGYRQNRSTNLLKEERNDSYNITTQFIANYAKTLGKHDINVTGGYESYYAKYENLSASRDQYEMAYYPYLDAGPELLRDNSGNAKELAYHSWFGRVMYNYDSKYLFQANVRADASSRFYEDYRWGTFPSFSAGWVASEEKFIKNLRMDWLSFLKVRGSWGKLGNERISDNYYPYQAYLSKMTAVFFDQGGKAIPVSSVAQWAYAVKDLTWETTETWDIGLDASFFDSRLHFTAEYYKKMTKDMLLSLEIPDYVGFDNPQRNAGKMKTTGYEFELGWSDKINDFQYSVSVNFSDFTSKMGDLKGTQFLDDQVKMEGSEFNEWYGYKSDGLYLTQADVDASPKLVDNVGVGDVKYRDISGPEGVPDGKISAEYDRTLLGGSLPHFLYGANVSLNWKNIDFSVAVQGIGKQTARVTPAMVRPLDGQWATAYTNFEGKYWSPYGTEAQNAAAIYPRISSVMNTNNYAISDFWLFNGRYFRVKNITLGYTLPQKWTKKVFMNRARLYVSANDPFCFSKYPDGVDPEAGPASEPIMTSVLFGLSVNF